VGHFTTVEPAVLVFGVLTVFLMGAAFLSLGMFVSSLMRHPITAATTTFGVSLLIYVIGNLGEHLPEKSPLPPTWPAWAQSPFMFSYTLFRSFLMELPLDAHAKQMAQGIFQAKDVAYYVLFTAFFLFLTFRALESRNWRG
jgi:ABC-2 type transport system permease protein